MASEINVKDIQVRVIPHKIATDFVRKNHYSGKVATTTKLHFGCFYRGTLHGVISYGSSMSPAKTVGLVDTHHSFKESWNMMLELNRMAFDNYLPKNSESRCLAITFRLLLKNAPHIKWILSYSDATASGDGTIYRACGFQLTKITPNKSILILPDGERVASLPLTNRNDKATLARVCKKMGIPTYSGATVKPILAAGARWAEGYQLRYIKLLDPACKIIGGTMPFSKIDEVGAGMYRGKRITLAERRGA